MQAIEVEEVGVGGKEERSGWDERGMGREGKEEGVELRSRSKRRLRWLRLSS